MSVHTASVERGGSSENGRQRTTFVRCQAYRRAVLTQMVATHCRDKWPSVGIASVVLKYIFTLARSRST
jgi:hypothetical protein